MKQFLLLALMVGASFAPAVGQDVGRIPPPILPVGGEKFEGWTGVRTDATGAALKLPGQANFQYPQGAKGWYIEGFQTKNDGTEDWRGYYGLQLEVQVPQGRTVELDVTLATPPPALQQEFLPESHAKCAVTGTAGWVRITLPWALFDFDPSQSAFLEFIQQLRLSGKFTDGRTDDEVRFRNIRLVRAPVIALKAEVRGRAVPAGGTAHYDVTLSNCTDSTQVVALSFQKEIWSVMTASVKPTKLQLDPGATASCVVTVQVPKEGVPPGAHESQELLASGNGNTPLAKLDLITARDVPRPSILHAPEGWAEVREKVVKYDWAKKTQDDLVNAANAWQVPEAATPDQLLHSPQGHIYVFMNDDFNTVQKVAIAWQLTRNKAYAEKVALFLRRLSDEKTGYASTMAGTSMGEPQEGGDFQEVAISYDAILDSGVLSEEDKHAIERMMRLYMANEETHLTVGNIGNWSTAASTAGLFCALSMGDLSAANRYRRGQGRGGDLQDGPEPRGPQARVSPGPARRARDEVLWLRRAPRQADRRGKRPQPFRLP